ncbi:hypothetical protein [Methanobrevibacter sp. DSM 116169]|uniref:hypothetical protein n=1 Tax=Methanobrevibacter sp. DSM 116169 TaxID=3242727 RepID=UPI0038FC5ADF
MKETNDFIKLLDLKALIVGVVIALIFKELISGYWGICFGAVIGGILFKQEDMMGLLFNSAFLGFAYAIVVIILDLFSFGSRLLNLVTPFSVLEMIIMEIILSVIFFMAGYYFNKMFLSKY